MRRTPHQKTCGRDAMSGVWTAVLGALVGVGLLTAVVAGRVSVPLSVARSAQQLGTTACAVPFHAQIAAGPDAGLRVEGDLQLAIDASGELHGQLMEADGTALSVVGQVNGRRLSVL